MAFRKILDSDVDRITAMAIQGVEAFITLYEEREEPVVAAGPSRPAPARRVVTSKRAAPRRKRL